MATVGGVASVAPRQLTARVTLAPFAVTVRFTLADAATVGLKRTVTACVVPTPTRLNELPDTTLKGVEVDAVPETVPPPVFWTVKVRSTKPPILAVPKSTVAVGLTVKSPRAAALVGAAHALSLPLVSTAVTET